MGEDRKPKVRRETREAEAREADSPHDADREPTEAEARAAEQEKLDREVSKQYREAAQREARTRGEGRIDP
jgi:hypothetical protein